MMDISRTHPGVKETIGNEKAGQITINLLELTGMMMSAFVVQIM